MKNEVKLLLMNIETLDPFHITMENKNCLHAVAFEGKVRTTKTLIKYLSKKHSGDQQKIKKDLNRSTNDLFQTALHIAVIELNIRKDRKSHYEEIIQLLLKNGADPFAYDLKCWNPSEYCNQR